MRLLKDEVRKGKPSWQWPGKVAGTCPAMSVVVCAAARGGYEWPSIEGSQLWTATPAMGSTSTSQGLISSARLVSS